MSDYDTDILVWSEHQAALLRRRAAGELLNEADLDWSNIAEEIESLGRSDRRELRRRIATTLVHLIKLEASPATDPRVGWRVTVLEQHAGLRDVLHDSPSLTRTVAAVVYEEIEAAREIAAISLAGEELRIDPATLCFTVTRCSGPGCRSAKLASYSTLAAAPAGASGRGPTAPGRCDAGRTRPGRFVRQPDRSTR